MWKRVLLLLCFSTLFSTLIAGNITNIVTNSTLGGKTSDKIRSINVPQERRISSTAETPKMVSGRIVNGTKAVLGQFPQQVSLRRRYSQSHFCGGSILTPKWIISAGHCMFDQNYEQLEPYTILVIAGEIVLKSTYYSRQWSKVDQIIVHEAFNIRTLQNDVALLKLTDSFTFDPYVQPIRIAPGKWADKTMCQVSGWGYQISGSNEVSPNLLYVDVPLLPIKLCKYLMQNYTRVPDGMFCAGYLEGGRDACQGDSGGGMLCNDFLTGVVSGGEGCAWPRLPGLYSDVYFYRSWIKRHVKDVNFYFSIRQTPYGFGAADYLHSSSPLLLVVLVAILQHVYFF